MTGAKSKSPDPGEATLLIVDDVAENRDLLSRRFKKRGFDVLIASDGPSALMLLNRQNVDLIILDVSMPGMSGLEVLEAVRKQFPASALPIIMATARSDSANVVEALNLGANDYVTKPIDFPVLHARVQAALRSRVLEPPPASGEIGPGTVIAGRYRLDSKLGEGGFGAVFRAVHTELERDVAVKVLHRAYSSGDLLERFRQEGVHACRVRHPNAVEVLDSGVTSSRIAFLAMELLEGESLEQEMRRGPIPFVRCAEILAPVCEALAAAHAADIVHRDIKPANIYLHWAAGRETPKVLDFGVAKLVGDAAVGKRITMEGSLVGTPAFMAPERFLNRRYDGRSDVYSIGVVLSQMITGRLPFALGTPGTDSIEPMALGLMHIEQEPIPLRTMAPDVPEALEALVLWALQKDPADRPTAAELAQKLVGAVEDLAPEATSRYAIVEDLENSRTAPGRAFSTTEVPAATKRIRRPTPTDPKD